MKIRSFLVSVAAISIILSPVMGLAGDWSPKGSITLQIGFGAGGSTDTIGRLVAAQVEGLLDAGVEHHLALGTAGGNAIGANECEARWFDAWIGCECAHPIEFGQTRR